MQVKPPVSIQRRLALAVRGVVQGVGFRPFVYNVAHRLGLTGWVRNQADTVRLEVQGESAALEAFLSSLRTECPAAARLEAIDAIDIAVAPDEHAFLIHPSETGDLPRPTIPADLATCAACLEELSTPGERRYGYAFTNCTNCGPRWSIIEGLPYDRPRTSMRGFEMCDACRREYDDPTDRRFHAQPIACPACGPSLRAIDPTSGHEIDSLATDEARLHAAVEALAAGRIVAIMGLGGFQLLVDATCATAVAELRRRKRRPKKPLAVMLASVDEARRRCEVSAAEARALTSPEAPIVLLRVRRDDALRDITPAVAPENPYLGVMLPYSPLHHRLMAAIVRPLVCTSGNLSEEPIVISADEAVERFGAVADLIVAHDRPIVRPVDDSVARVGPDGLEVLRRARGFAPLPLTLATIDADAPTVLAVGGHLKNTVALNIGRQVVMSAHVGDLDNLWSLEVFRRAIDDLIEFFRAKPAAIACDLHPDYASTRHAEELAARWSVPLVRVQHHHAHAAASMAEHGIDGPALALSWDGTGYGTDGTVWGGEAMVCRRDAFERVAHLRPFALPGGDRAAREPRRAALGLLYEALGAAAAVPASAWFSPSELGPLVQMLDRKLNSPRTSSMGRLFDAMAALVGLGDKITFEAEAAMALEFAADDEEHAAYPLPLSDGPRHELQGQGGQSHFRCRCAADTKIGTVPVLDWQPMLEAALADREAGVPVGKISARFHNALAEAAVAVARRAGCDTVLLTGGCFQNARLTQVVHRRLFESGFRVLLHHRVPPGDGGIALGQLFVALLKTPTHEAQEDS